MLLIPVVGVQCVYQQSFKTFHSAIRKVNVSLTCNALLYKLIHSIQPFRIESNEFKCGIPIYF